jgi:hypothetical protein
MLGYGPPSVTTLSPPTAMTRSGIGARPSRRSTQPSRPAVETTTEVATTLSLGPTIERTFQVPATSARLTAPPWNNAIRTIMA